MVTTKVGWWTRIWSTRHWKCRAGSALLISIQEKLNLFHLTSLITLVLLMWKWMGLFLRKSHLSRCWGYLSALNWIGALALSLLLKLPARKLDPMKFLSLEVALYLYTFTIPPCIEYCCLVWGSPSYYSEIL